MEGGGLVTVQADDLTRLRKLCSVLGNNYNDKLKEFKIKKGKQIKSRTNKRLLECINGLQKEKEDMFEEIKPLCRDLINIWKSTHTPLKKLDLGDIFMILDAQSSDELVAPKILSTDLEDDIKDEILRLTSAPRDKILKKYRSKKKKLEDLMKQSALVAYDIGSGLEDALIEKEEDDELVNATTLLKHGIQDAEELVLSRKELVFRVEAAKDAVTLALPLKKIDVLVGRAIKEAASLKSRSQNVLRFRGMEISGYLDSLPVEGDGIRDASAGQYFDELAITRSEATIAGRTRSGTMFGSAVPDVTAVRQNSSISTPGAETSSEAESTSMITAWNTKDRKRLINVDYSVEDLEHSIESYDVCFGMKLLRKVEDQGRNCTIAVLGFGQEDTNFTLQLTYYHDAPMLHIGRRFGNFAIACNNAQQLHEIVDRIKLSSSWKIILRPASINTRCTQIAVVQDPTGYFIQLIERGPTIHVCHLMLRVVDLDLSVKFYVKGLGMKLLKRGYLPNYETKIAALSFVGAENTTVLKLTSNDGITEYDKGNANIEVTIGTENVQKSIQSIELVTEELGGQVFPGPVSANTACFLDPDGWKMVLVDNDSFFKSLLSSETECSD